MPDIMSAEEILRRLKSRGREYDYPRAGDRKFWEELAEDKRQNLIAKGEAAQARSVDFLSVKDYMKFFRTGNRIDFETPYFRRRYALTALVLAECAELYIFRHLPHTEAEQVSLRFSLMKTTEYRFRQSFPKR